MKTMVFLVVRGFRFSPSLALTLMLASLGTAFGQTDPAAPAIKSVRREGTNVVVTVQVPAGLRRVTLECRERLGPGAWEPRAVLRLDGTGGDSVIRIAATKDAELMRVRADTVDPLPAAFYSGTNAFYEAGGSPQGPAVLGPNDVRNETPGPAGQDTTRTVVESDIWKIQGQTLYFFNQLRGLQVINISNPDMPVVAGTLELPAAGEDLYVLDDAHVVLLANPGCDYTSSQVLVVTVANGQPSVTATLPVPGWLLESRLVGSALYVAAQSYRPVDGTTNTVWEWGTVVSSFDLADPAKPVARTTLWYSGYGNVVAATDRLLFVVTQDPANWWQSVVRCIDITNPDGTMNTYTSVRTAGRVPDKFKINWQDGVLTTISEDWRSTAQQRLTTVLENFRLPDPRSAGPGGVIQLGQLELGGGEQLQATRFDGRLVYVVTFFRIDPLWVVDLSDPTAPHIAGSVNVPGWSTFIQPLGDRLVTIGIESNKVAVSLFDVGDPTAPSLLSRVRLGQNYSWSEANWDEKAFNVLPDAGLILVPFTSDTTNGYASSVQLVDLSENSLVARGVIQHTFQPRRSTVYSDRILSISQWQLLSVDASDRDHPEVRSTTTLAWPVDRVVLHGDFVIEVGAMDGWSWYAYGGSSSPVLRVAAANEPNRVLGQLPLGELPVLSVTSRGERLYVLQGPGGYFYPYPILVAGADPGAPGDGIPQSKFTLTVVSLAGLPALSVLGEADAAVDGPAGGDFQALWPGDDTLVFAGGGFPFWYRCWECPVPLAAGSVNANALIAYPFWGGVSGGQLLAFQVGDSANPAFASSVNLASNQWWNFSRAFTAQGLVYVSHQTSEFIPLDPTAPVPKADVNADPALIIYPAGNWVSRSFLDVVDYADARQPLVRAPVSIPGQLNGISHQGAVLYTVGTHWTTNIDVQWTEYLDASAYDGVSAHQIDSLVLSNSWPRPLLIADGIIFIGVYQAPTGTGAAGVVIYPGGYGGTSLETWRLSDAGKFTRIGQIQLATSTSTLANFGALLAAQQTDNTLVLLDASDPSSLKNVGNGRPPGCVWYDLSHADGALGRGVWVSLGDYGVARIPTQP